MKRLKANKKKLVAKPGQKKLTQTTTEFTPTQFHIQTDEGDNRFFKYQTWNGSFRKEVTLEDGSVVGRYALLSDCFVFRGRNFLTDSL